MKVQISLFVISFALVVNGCANPVDLEAEAAAIRQLTDVNWLEAGKTRDLDRWMSHYTDDTIFFPPGGAPVVGKKAMQKLISEFLNNPGNSAAWETTAVKVSPAGDMAYSYGPQQNITIDEQGNLVTDNLKWSIVWEKQPDGSWKCAFMTMDFDEPTATSELEADMQAVLDFEQSVFDAEIEGDFEAWMSSFAEDVTLFPPNTPPLKGKLAVRKFNAPIFDKFDLHESSDEREITVAGDWAYIRAHWIWILTPKNGGEEIKDTGNSIWILNRQPDDSWKIARAIWNSDKPISGKE